MASWPESRDELVREQERLARAEPPPWRLPAGPIAIGGCFVCFARGGPDAGPGAAGDPGWAGAAVLDAAGRVHTAVAAGAAGAPYEAGLLAAREGALLEAAVRALPFLPDALLVDATGRDHPRGAGLALHLGAVLDLPTAGVTHRLLAAEGEWPEDRAGAAVPFHCAGELAGHWLRTRAGTRPLAVHAAWRTDPHAALELVRASLRGTRTPAPVREARRVARTARAGASRGS
jgi:deoxyribonuclease V